MARDLSLLLPEIVVLLGAVGALIAEMLRSPRAALVVLVAGLAGAVALTVPMIDVETTVFGGTFRIDALSAWAKLTLLPATALCLLLARADVRGSAREGTLYSLLGFTTLGALILAGAGDMMLLVLGILLTGLASFALVAFPRTDVATEAAMKFFVFASVTGAVMIFGLTFWFGAAGSTLLAELYQLDSRPLAAALGLVAVIVGVGYKAALVPFHFWAPDAYEGAPLSVAAYLSVVPKIGAIFALAQVVRDLPPTSGWTFLMAALAVLSMTYGYLAALVQENVIRLLAYSSIAQSGYFLLGVVALGESSMALPALVVFAAAYAAMNLGAFAVVAHGGRTLEALRGLGRLHPFVGVAMVMFLVSLVGIPPLGGFVGKFMLFGTAMDAHFTWLAVIAIINSVIALAAYLRVVVPMYQRGAAGASSGTSPSPWISFVIWVTLVATIGVGIAAQGVLGPLG